MSSLRKAHFDNSVLLARCAFVTPAVFFVYVISRTDSNRKIVDGNRNIGTDMLQYKGVFEKGVYVTRA